MTQPSRTRCMAQALMPGGYWKTCMRDASHPDSEPHTWVEALNRASGRPILAEWAGTRCGSPLIAEVLLPAAAPPAAELEFPDNYKVISVPQAEIRLITHPGQEIVFSSIDHDRAPVSLATLLEAAEAHEGGS